MTSSYLNPMCNLVFLNVLHGYLKTILTKHVTDKHKTYYRARDRQASNGNETCLGVECEAQKSTIVPKNCVSSTTGMCVALTSLELWDIVYRHDCIKFQKTKSELLV